MTDEPAQASGPEPDPALARARIEPSVAAKRRDLLPVLYLVGFVALAGTLFYLWQNPPESHLAPQEASRVDALQAQMASLREDVSKLQQQKPPPPGPSQAAFDKLQNQASALESRPVVAPDQLQGLTQQVQGLTQQVQALPKQAPDLAPLTQRIDALEKRPQVDPAATDAKIAAAVAAMDQKTAALTAGIEQKIAGVTASAKPMADQVQQLASRVDETAKLGPRLDQVQARLDELDKQQKQMADQLKTASQRIAVATKLQGAAAALASGQKLGEIPGAPPALARFASEAPPTEAALRESFEQYAAAAQKASQPAITDNQDFGARLWTRAQQAVTVRQGDRVLVGDPITGVLAHAKEQLDNGSLGGATETLKGLAGPAASAMQPWVDKARALLDARAALAAMAAG